MTSNGADGNRTPDLSEPGTSEGPGEKDNPAADLVTAPLTAEQEEFLRLELPKAIANRCLEDVERLTRDFNGAVGIRFDHRFEGDDDLALGVTPLMLAATSNNSQIVESLIGHGADIHAATFSMGSTALHIAAKCGNLQITKILIDHGANLHSLMNDRATALHLAAECGHEEICKLLLEYGADCEAKDEDEWTPLFFASQDGYSEVAKILLKKGATTNVKSNNGTTPLHLTAKWGYEEVCKLLLDHGADYDAKTDSGRTALFLASQRGYVEISTILLEKGAEANVKIDNGMTPLHVATQNRHVEICKLLLDYGADYDAKDNSDWTPIALASSSGNVEISTILLEKGSNVNVETKAGSMPLHLAAENGHVAVMKMLIGRTANINKTNNSGETPLHRASWLGYLEAVELLLKEGIDTDSNEECKGIKARKHTTTGKINTKRKNSPGPALNRDHIGTKSFEPVIEKRVSTDQVDVTICDKYGDTALSNAAYQNHVDIMLQLLKNKSYFPEDPVKFQTCIATPYEASQIDTALVEFLKKFDKNARHMQDSETVIYWAVANGRLSLMQECILCTGLDVRSWTRGGATLLHVAARYGHLEVVKELLNYNISIEALNYQGMTALHLGASNGHRATVKHLLDELFGDKTTESSSGIPQNYKRIELIVKKNDDGDSLVSLAMKGRHGSIEALLSEEFKKFGEDNSQVFKQPYSELADQVLESLVQIEKPEEEHILKSLLKKDGTPGPGFKPRSWTALHWAVFRHHEVLVWWLLSNGGHFKSKELGDAFEIANKIGISRDSSIAYLLHNPPPILAHVAYQDDDALVQLPSENDANIPKLPGAIVDFYLVDENIEIQFKQQVISDIIYTEGPHKLMAQTKNQDHFNLNKLKERRRNNQHSAEPEKKLASQDTIASVSETAEELTRPHLLNESADENLDLQKKPQEKENAQRPANEKLPPPNHQFRWLHIPVNHMNLVEDLLVRISADSGKKQKEHRSLVDFLKQSWTELAAGGEKHYMKPRFILERLSPKAQQVQIDQNGHSNTDQIQKKVSESTREGAFANPADDVPMDKNKTESNSQQAAKKYSKSSKGNRDRAALYMPYLSLGDKPSETNQSPRTSTQNQSPKHETMTLDQYYYAALKNTDDRDDDQVLSRYLRKYEKGATNQILMVGQLWLWIVDETTIITATADQSHQFVDVVFQNLFFNPQRPKSTESLMKLITSIQTGLFIQTNIVVGQQKPKGALDIFRESIRDVANEETKLYRCFIDSLRNTGPNNGERKQRDNPHHNILRETELLREIKDIRDELNILTALAEDQDVVWKQVYGTEKLEHSTDSLCTPTFVKEQLDEMAEEAKMVQDSIDSLLDLKQKQASIKEAEFGRQQAESASNQAEDTARQSNTIMVFTVVTIVFLPLSFLTSFFALNITNFPHEGGDVRYKGWWILPIIFGASAAVSIPCIFIAFKVNWIISKFKPSEQLKNGQDQKLRTVPGHTNNFQGNSSNTLRGPKKKMEANSEVPRELLSKSSQPGFKGIFGYNRPLPLDCENGGVSREDGKRSC